MDDGAGVGLDGCFGMQTVRGCNPEATLEPLIEVGGVGESPAIRNLSHTATCGRTAAKLGETSVEPTVHDVLPYSTLSGKHTIQCRPGDMKIAAKPLHRYVRISNSTVNVVTDQQKCGLFEALFDRLICLAKHQLTD